MKTKKRVKKPKLTSLQEQLLLNNLLQYFLWVEENGDLINPYVLDVNLKPFPAVKPPKPSRKVYSLSKPTNIKNFVRLKKPKPLVLRFIYGFISVILLIILIQLIYPRGISTPFASISGQGSAGFAGKQKILSSLSSFDSRIVTVHTHTKDITTGYRDLGVTIDPETTVNNLTIYSLKKRFLPFSILFNGHNNPIARGISEPQLNLFVKDVVAIAGKKPVNAFVSLNGTEFKISPSEEGSEYQVSALKSAVLVADLSDKGQIVFSPTVLFPDISSELAGSVVLPFQNRLKNPLVVSSADNSTTFDVAQMASWVDIFHHPAQKKLEISFNKTKVTNALISLKQSVDYPAKPPVTTMLNGAQAGRTDGANGRSVSLDELVKQVMESPTISGNSISVAPVDIVPKEVIERRYSKDNTGMQNLLDYWTASHKGQYGISFQTLNGRILASTNSGRLFPAVGINKAYIAGLIYNRIAGGVSLSLSSRTTTGDSVANCLNKMIVNSNEACTNALGDIIGWSSSDNQLLVQGFTSTSLAYGASLTTAEDSANWLVKLSNSSITTVSHTNALTSLMSNQSIRTGIPAGSPGIRVDNKSGASGRFINDIALVHYPKGAYALAIMSEGSSYAQFADLANEINKVISQ